MFMWFGRWSFQVAFKCQKGTGIWGSLFAIMSRCGQCILLDVILFSRLLPACGDPSCSSSLIFFWQTCTHRGTPPYLSISSWASSAFAVSGNLKNWMWGMSSSNNRSGWASCLGVICLNLAGSPLVGLHLHALKPSWYSSLGWFSHGKTRMHPTSRGRFLLLFRPGAAMVTSRASSIWCWPHCRWKSPNLWVEALHIWSRSKHGSTWGELTGGRLMGFGQKWDQHIGTSRDPAKNEALFC